MFPGRNLTTSVYGREVRPRRYSALRSAPPPEVLEEPQLRQETCKALESSQSFEQFDIPGFRWRPPQVEMNAIRSESLMQLLQRDISIITYRGIRYEGKLCSVDTVIGTITLQNGECSLSSISTFPASMINVELEILTPSSEYGNGATTSCREDPACG